MERLTRRGEDGKGYFKALDPDCTCNRECPRLWEHMQMLSDRLAAYEDTGLEPDEIKAMHDRDNRLKSDAVKPVEIEGVKNEPLTIDELRKMDGEPIWVVPLCNDSGWASQWIIHKSVGLATVRAKKDKLGLYDLYLKDYGKGWIAYRNKPEEGQK